MNTPFSLSNVRLLIHNEILDVCCKLVHNTFCIRTDTVRVNQDFTTDTPNHNFSS